MPVYLDTRGNTKIAIAICGRCGLKFPYSDLVEDGNIPGLFVCPDDRDTIDPWRLPARASDDMTLEHPRPDVRLGVSHAISVFANQAYGISSIAAPVPWSAATGYAKGASITPVSVASQTATLPLYSFSSTADGVSGASAPSWTNMPGTVVQDGTLSWLNLGIYPN